MADIHIRIPRGCQCVNVDIGEHSSQVVLPTPAHMLELGSIGCLQFRETTCVDRCIADAVQALWAHGVVTTGCCCGHNKVDGYIGIWEAAPSTHTDNTETLRNALARIEELEAALSPFAELADQLDGSPADGIEPADDEEWAKFRLLVSDYRRARAAMSVQRPSDAPL